MMAEQTAPKLSKVPFLAGDVLLLAVAGWLVLRPGPPLDVVHNALVAACVALGAWLGALPFLVEFRAARRFAEAGELASAVAQIKDLQAVGELVTAATGRWQTVQESADKTARAAKEIASQIATEARSFTEAMQKTHDAEVRNLRLEVEKLRRAEGDWLQVLVRMLDHVFALYSAGIRTGQAGLIEQLAHFQLACRDAARRLGLAPLEPVPESPFDPKLHELPEGQPAVEGGLIAAMLAPGYTYQGQLLRRAMVTLKPAESVPSAGPDEAQLPQGAADAPAERS